MHVVFIILFTPWWEKYIITQTCSPNSFLSCFLFSIFCHLPIILLIKILINILCICVMYFWLTFSKLLTPNCCCYTFFYFWTFWTNKKTDTYLETCYLCEINYRNTCEFYLQIISTQKLNVFCFFFLHDIFQTVFYVYLWCMNELFPFSWSIRLLF